MGKKHIEVLLTEPVLKLGDMGQVVSVKAGYARNYLLPRGHAVPAVGAAKRQIEVLQEKARQAEVAREGQALRAKKELDGFSVQIPAKVAHDDQLFGSVGIRDIVRALKDSGFEVDPRQVHQHESFKKLGRYQVVIKLHRKVEATISVEVVNADPDGPGMDEALGERRPEQAGEERR